MSIDLYLGFVAASLLLIAMPGPNVALIVANSIRHGVGFGLWTVVGTTSAMVIQLALTVAGMSLVLTTLAQAFDVLRWAGVAYLLYLAWRAFTAPAADLSARPAEAITPRRAALRGFLVSLTNPKTLLFYGAFLPQFVAPGAAATEQLVLLSATFVVLAGGLDGVWALAAARLAPMLTVRARLHNIVTGAVLALAGLGLALARRP